MLKLNIQRFADGEVILEVDLDTKSFEKQIAEVEYELEQIDFELQHAKQLKLDSRTIDEYNVKAEKLRNKLKDLNDKQEEINKEGFKNVLSSVSNVGNSVENVIQKVKRWALAVFGIRSAYTLVRNAMSTLTQYDKQLGANVEYIRYMLAVALKPIVETLINLAYKLLTYVNYIAKAWFGVDLFAKATVKSFNKVNTGIKNTNKSAKELQKTLTGFDEMNILQKDGSVVSGGGGGGIATDPFFKDMYNVKIPDWIDWIAKNGRTIAEIIGLIAGAIATLKIYDFIKSFQGASGTFNKFKTGLLLVEIGLGTLAIQLIKTWQEFDKMTDKQKGVSEDLAGLGGAFAGMGTAMLLGASTMGIAIGGIIGAITGLLAWIGVAIYKHEEERKKIYDVTQQEKDLRDIKKKQIDVYKDYTEQIDRQKDAYKNLNKLQKETGYSGKELYEQEKQGTITYEQMNKKQKEVYKAYLELIGAKQKAKEATKAKNEIDQKELETQYKKKIAADETGKSYEKLRDEIIKSYEDHKLTASQTQELLNRMMGKMDAKTMETFGTKIPDAIKKGLDPMKYKSTMDKFKNWFTGEFNKALNNIKPKKKTTKFTILGSVTSEGYAFAKGGIIYNKLPKLAPGGIINQPGRGVPLVSAIGGERGAEGVIPLTDSQQMALLGEAIGKYITVNANIINTMNGRVISKELKKVQNGQDFAYNR